MKCNYTIQTVEWKTETKDQGASDAGFYGLGTSVYGVWKPNNLTSYTNFLNSDEYYRSIDNYQMYYREDIWIYKIEKAVSEKLFSLDFYDH